MADLVKWDVEIFVPAVEMWVLWFPFGEEACAWGCYNDFNGVGINVRVRERIEQTTVLDDIDASLKAHLAPREV
jgi:hypothetical protein